MKNSSIRWQNIKLNRTTPFVYPRYFGQHPSFVPLVSGHHFYIDDKESSGEVFYEKVANGFWLLALEMQAKANNRYILEAKDALLGYFSINIFYSLGKIGYRDPQETHWANDHVIFLRPLSKIEILLEKGTVLRCCRLIFTGSYLADLINQDSTMNRQCHANNADMFSHILSYRSAVRAEIFLQDRLYDVLRFKRRSYHYQPSLFSILFELTAFFLSLLSKKRFQTVVRKKNTTMLC
ncbi:hypothetical protein BDE36_2843 [Arcticibacter tournemirensis]|uniref:Uncharacterized protein n=1 Tax=Arcticibacter tournemirensis TaxID=699437 RepID=A0A4Q0MFW0_9SPHI|nr:hypothetical protein [Arcticibacter tournemirensis]KAA8482774.1 hypothetical protein F1649_11020 [Arcticibacter tournemirensis]RXF72204.1 hypothetical protein EKH83_00315 [Arcticibacter tournemirensis]TQM51075.1 hypothetical protein BDE36_2843 [Arcticibacter tournemirensis]